MTLRFPYQGLWTLARGGAREGAPTGIIFGASPRGRLPAVLAVLLLVGMLAGCRKNSPYQDPDGLGDLVAGRGVPYLLVDVRTSGEYTYGHLPTAVNIPHDRILERPPSRDLQALIILYCNTGARSRGAAQALQLMGYRNVVDFGAIGRWHGPLVTESLPGCLSCGDH